MEIVNYTGKSVGLSSEAGHPIRVLGSAGNAHCKVVLHKDRVVDGVLIFSENYTTVKGLPAPDSGLNKRFIVTPEVAKAEGNGRVDLLVGAEPYQFKGQMFFKYLMAV